MFARSYRYFTSVPFLFFLLSIADAHSHDLPFLSLRKGCSYQKIGDMYMRSFGLDNSLKQTNGANSGKSQKKCSLSLSESEKRSIIFNLLANQEKKGDNRLCSDKLLHTALEDLEFFHAPGRDHGATLFAHLNNTRTVFGEVVLAKMLANPTVDVDLLQKRQAFIQELISNELLFNELDNLMEKVHSAEESILSFWKDENEVTQSAINKLYFSKPGFRKFNTSALALELRARLQNTKTALLMGGDILFLVGIHQLVHRMGECVGLQRCSWKQSAKDVGKYILDWFNPITWYNNYHRIYSPEFAEELREGQVASRDIFRSVLRNMDVPELRVQDQIPDLSNQELDRVVNIGRKTTLGMTMFQGLLFFSYVTWRAFAIKNALSSALQDRNTQLYLQNHLINVATLILSLKKAQGLAARNLAMEEGLTALDKISHLFEDSGEACTEAKHLVKLLQSWTFRGTASTFSSAGRILAAYKLIGSAKDDLIPVMGTTGEIDACLSIAKLYKKHMNQPVHYCFAEYAESEKPYINAKAFWNPIVGCDSAIPNNLVLGGEQEVRNAIVTGSNTGGKSTSLKALVICALLAQTCGIAPANEFMMTPFEQIATSFNVKDDTEAGTSLFKAEVMRAQKLIEVAQKLKKGQRAFFTIDELFTGTSPKKGPEVAYDIALRLALVRQLCYVWSTHYPLLTSLEKDSHGICKNYKMEAYKDQETGKLMRPYKLEDGVSTSNIAGDILEAELKARHTDVDASDLKS